MARQLLDCPCPGRAALTDALLALRAGFAPGPSHNRDLAAHSHSAPIERKDGTVARIELADCRHSPHRDQPEATLAAIADFVATT